MEEYLILMMILCGIICLIAYKAKSRIIMLIGSMGWVITGLEILINDPTIPTHTIAFFIAIAVSVILVVPGDR